MVAIDTVQEDSLVAVHSFIIICFSNVDFLALFFNLLATIHKIALCLLVLLEIKCCIH